ncbi:MAG: hypothetical protein HKN48_02015 [Flavobacteriaceae bacterium]|nr:hypothetical protein [Flavobacteriaceae bacterium]
MTKNLFLVLVVFTFFFPANLFAQEDRDYKMILETTTDPSVKLEALDSLIDRSRRNNIDDFIKYSLDYIELAKEIDSINSATKKLINVSYSLTSIKNEPRKTLTLVDGLLARKYKIKDSFLLGSLHLKRGSANYRLDLEEAIQDYKNAIKNYSKRDSVHIADAYLFSGQAYSNLGKFVPAGENYKKAYEYFEFLKDYEYMFYARQGITAMYSMNGFYEKAREERVKNIEKIKELGLEHHLTTAYYNQALDYKKMGDTRQYFAYLQMAEDAINNAPEASVNTTNKLYVYSKLVDYYCAQNEIANAEKYLAMLVENHKQGPDDLINQIQYDDAMANYHLALGNYNKALDHANNRLAHTRSIKIEEDIMESYRLLSEIYAAKGNYKLSLDNKNSYLSIKDSIYNKTNANTLAYYQTLYETEKKENELIEKSTNIQLLEKDNEAAKKRLLFIIIALISLFGMVILYRNRLRIKNKKIRQEKFSQELLVSQEEERKRISKDLHDGLGQRLLLIKNKVVETHDKETKELVETAIDEVRSISRNLHPFQLQELGITKAIKMTINQIDENSNLFISSEIDNIDNIFSKKQEVNIYRIVQEALSNILKHANAEAGKVVVKREPNMVSVTIRDNGVGFDFTEKYQNMKSLGLKTLLERTKFLKGQMKIQSRKESGTLLEFQFPTA